MSRLSKQDITGRDRHVFHGHISDEKRPNAVKAVRL